MKVRQYDKEFKLQAIALSEEIGPLKAAERLGVPRDTLYGWRKQIQERGEQSFVGSGHSFRATAGKTQREVQLEQENAELRRANEILKDALGFFAKDRKK